MPMNPLPAFDIHLDQNGRKSMVKMNGEELCGVQSVEVVQRLYGEGTLVTIQFLAASVNRPVADTQ